MKKLTVFAVLAAAAMTAALSCSKENNAPVFIGKPVTVQVDGPTVEQDPATSVVLTGTSPYTVAWEAGDRIQIVNYQHGTDTRANKWDYFTTAAGGATATFSGTAGAVSDGYKFAAFSVYEDALYKTYYYDSGKSNMIYANIPATQDGTGIKYSLYATRNVTYSDGTLTITGMALRSALTRLDIAGTAVVKRFTVTVSYEKLEVSGGYGLCVGPNPAVEKTMPVYNFKNDDAKFSNAVGGKGGTITIENGGARLIGPLYIASRHTVANATGGECKLTFVFTDENDRTCTKTVTLVTADIATATTDNPATKAITIDNGKLNILGTVTLNTEDFS